MQYLLDTWDDDKIESKQTVLYTNQLDEALNIAVETKQLNPNLVVKLFKRDHADSYLITHVKTIELTEEQKLADYWDHSITGVLKNKQVYSINDTDNV